MNEMVISDPTLEVQLTLLFQNPDRVGVTRSTWVWFTTSFVPPVCNLFHCVLSSRYEVVKSVSSTV